MKNISMYLKSNSKALIYLLISISITILPTYIISKYDNDTFKGLIILFLFFVYPVVSLVFGILRALMKINIILSLAIFMGSFLFIVMYFLNSSALFYIPFYLVFYMLGNLIIKPFYKQISKL